MTSLVSTPTERGKKVIFSNYCVRKRTNRSDKWQGIAKYKDKNGWHSKSVTFPDTVKTERQAKKALNDWILEMESELEDTSIGSTSKVYDYASDYIEMRSKSGTIEPSTVRDYEGSLKRVARGLGGVRMCDLDDKKVIAWERGLLEEGLTNVTVAKTHRFLKQVCSHAVAIGDLQRHPMLNVKPPRRPRSRPNALKRSDRPGLNATLAQMEPTPLVTAVAMALYCGMREGEICGLRWSDVDLKRGTIEVSRSIGLRKGGSYVKEPKNETSIRSFTMPDGLLPFLKRRRAAAVEECLESGIEFKDKLYVIGSTDGSWVNPQVISKGWSQLSRALGLVGTQGKTVTFHDLRHSFATIAIAEHADVKSVADIMGHSNAAMTLNVYADADPEAKRGAMERVNAATDVSVA